MEEALKYISIGFSVIPIGRITKDKSGKKTISYPVPWKKFQKARATEQEVLSWKCKNLGVVTGRLSNILVLDVDKYKPKYDATFVKNLNLPVTPIQKTASGGNQYFFRYPKDVEIRNDVSLIHPDSGIDIRGEGGMVIVPPTTTSYGEYSWILSPFDTDFAEAPQSLIDAILAEGGASHKKSKPITSLVSTSQGSRNAAMTSFIGKMLAVTPEAQWEKEVYPVALQVNKTYHPPLPEEEVKTIFRSISAAEQEKTSSLVEGQVAADILPTEIIKEFVKNKTKGTYLLALYLVNKYDIITVGEKEREMFIYEGGIYRRAENEIIYPEIQKVLGNQTTKNAKTETFHKVADMTSHPRTIFESAPFNIIPLKNGVYDMETKKLLPHDPKYRFTYQFPIVFDPAATCPATESFMHDVLTDEQYPTVQEWMGYYFYRRYAFKKAIIFVGEGDTGKTTLLETIMYLLGKENISSVSLQKMSSDKFAAAYLYEKHGNLVDELSARDIQDTGNFKIATGGGSISGEYKFGNQFTFNNFSKLTFACNKIPDVKDFDDEAYFNRWMIMRFEKTIEKKIPNFIRTLTTEEERSGLFNWAMEGLRRLLEQGTFSYGKTAMDTKREMMRSGSSIAVFAADRVTQEPGAEISKEDMYEEYSKHCVENGLPTESIKMFGTKFLFYVAYASEGLISDGMKRVRGWKNVVVVPTKDEEAEDKKLDKELDDFGK